MHSGSNSSKLGAPWARCQHQCQLELLSCKQPPPPLPSHSPDTAGVEKLWHLLIVDRQWAECWQSKVRRTGSREEEIRDVKDATFFFPHAIFCKATCQKGVTETGTTIGKERVGELQKDEQGSCGFKLLKTKGKCRCWEAGWLHNSGKLLFTQIKPAGLLERLCVFLVQRSFCFHLYQCTAVCAACVCVRNMNVIVSVWRVLGRA